MSATFVRTHVFTREEVERARRYHRPAYVAAVAGLVIDVVLLAAFAFGAPGDWLDTALGPLPWWAAALAFPALVVAAAMLVRTPLAFWRGYVHEHRWGFSTQSVGGWLADRAKALVVDVVLASLVVFSLVALARALPSAWPIAGAAAAAALVVVLMAVAPLVIEPLFNRYRPLAGGLARDLAELSVAAGVPVRGVLEADASRRTRKQNAYVSGLGPTRRLVVWDTLVADRAPREIRIVVAHELGHRRAGHLARATALAAAGAVAFVLLLWVALQWQWLRSAAGAAGPGDPRVAPFVLLAGSLLQLAASPLLALVSRRFEREADRFSLELTRDPDAYEAMHRSLATENLIDLAPPRALYVLFSSHPPPPERIAAGRRWAATQAAESGSPA